MKILVTGGAGFIGSHVVDQYIEHGHEVVIVDDLSTGRVSNLNPEATFYQMDIRDPNLKEVFAIERPDVVNHHAAQMNVRRSVSDPLFDADVNVVGSVNLIECAKLFGVRRFIYISTGGAVYGEPEYVPCDENHPIIPVCQYGISKHTVEHYLYLYFLNYGLESIVLRYPNVYGPRQDPHGEAGVIAIFTGQMLANDEVTINGDGKQTRDYVYVGDCARANLLALQVAIPHGIFNIGSCIGTSVNELFEKLSLLTDYTQKPIHGPAKVGETRHIYLDATNAERTLGWRFETPLDEGLMKTVEYFRSAEVLKSIRVDVKSSEPYQGRINGKSQSVEGSGMVLDQDVYKRSQESEFRLGLLHFEQGESVGSMSISKVLETAIKTVGADSGSLFILDDEGNLEKSVIAFRNEVTENQNGELSAIIKEGLAGWVLRNGHPAVIANTREDPRWRRSSWEVQDDISRSAISVPVLSNSDVCGALTLSHPHEGQFTDEHLALLGALVTMLAINGGVSKQN